MTVVVLTYDEIPPSSNDNHGVGGRGHPKAIGKTKRKWGEIFDGLLIASKLPRDLHRVRVTCELKFTDKRRRDADNFYFPIAKPLGDSLTKGLYIPDDTWAHYEFERVRISPDRLEGAGPLVKGNVTLTIEYE